MRFPMRNWISVVLFSSALSGQTRLALNDAVSEALRANPQLPAGLARVDAAKGLRRQAGLGPNPVLTLQSENARLWGSPGFVYGRDADAFAYIGQTIETGGKRDRRVDFANETVKRLELESQLQRQQIAGRVRAAWGAAAGAARYRDLLRDEEVRFGSVVAYHRNRVREGASAEIDLLRIELERDRLRTSANAAERDAERAKIALFREMGRTEFADVAFADASADAKTVEILSLDRVFERRLEIALAREGVDQAQANLRLQQANARGNPDVYLGYKRSSGFDTVYASLQIPLTLRNRNQGQIESASSEIRVAESQIAAAQAIVRSEVEMARREYEGRQRTIATTLAPMRDRADEVYRIAEAAYREGGIDILRMLDAERARLEARAAHTRAVIELQQSAIELSIAQGGF